MSVRDTLPENIRNKLKIDAYCCHFYFFFVGKGGGGVALVEILIKKKKIQPSVFCIFFAVCHA